MGCLLCSLAFIILAAQQFTANRAGVLVALGVFVTCFLAEWLYKRYAVNQLKK